MCGRWVFFSFSGQEGRRDSVGVWSAERSLRFQIKADVYKGSSRCFWLLHGSRKRNVLLASLLLRKATLRCLRQTVFFLFLLLLQQKCVCVSFNIVYLRVHVCVLAAASA